jgi:hypothetical protein
MFRELLPVALSAARTCSLVAVVALATIFSKRKA